MKKRLKQKITLEKIRVSKLNNLNVIKGGSDSNGIGTCNSGLIVCSNACGE